MSQWGVRLCVRWYDRHSKLIDQYGRDHAAGPCPSISSLQAGVALFRTNRDAYPDIDTVYSPGMATSAQSLHGLRPRETDQLLQCAAYGCVDEHRRRAGQSGAYLSLRPAGRASTARQCSAHRAFLPTMRSDACHTVLSGTRDFAQCLCYSGAGWLYHHAFGGCVRGEVCLHPRRLLEREKMTCLIPVNHSAFHGAVNFQYG